MTTSFVYKPITELLNPKIHFNQGFLGYLALWNVNFDSPAVIWLEDVTKNENGHLRKEGFDPPGKVSPVLDSIMPRS